MPNIVKKILFKSVLWISDRFSSKPDRKRVFKELTDLHKCIKGGDERKGLTIPFDTSSGKFIIFSDQHKGAENGADDFMVCRSNYLAALEHYRQNNFFFIALGDCEELWENTIFAVKKHQHAAFEAEGKFIEAKSFIKIFGNHDLYWGNDPFAHIQLKQIFGVDVPIHEGVILKTNIDGKELEIFCTHGHQGDRASDGNWFSKWFVSNIWAPLQAFTKINPNTPANNEQLKTLHNDMMYDWSSQQQNLLLLTGHTHQPVFESMTHAERTYKKLLLAENQKDQETIDSAKKELSDFDFSNATVRGNYLSLKSTYFNSGCCCFDDGDITGIEIEEGCIRLIKWQTKGSSSERIVLEEKPLSELVANL